MSKALDILAVLQSRDPSAIAREVLGEYIDKYKDMLPKI